MTHLSSWLGASVLPLLCLTACPVTDDYYLLAASGGAAAGSSAAQEGGEPGTGGGAAASAASGGSNATAGSTNEGGASSAGAPFSTVGECQDFTVNNAPDHQYRYCPAPKTWQDARDDCLAAGLRLLWLETASENNQVSNELAKLGDDAEVFIGANDQGEEGQWRWGPGDTFWQGDSNGQAVDKAFTAWEANVPNDDNGGEDCGVLYPDAATWGDKSCDELRPYACEQLD